MLSYVTKRNGGGINEKFSKASAIGRGPRSETVCAAPPKPPCIERTGSPVPAME